ncbi:lipopolysaccharide biosynthesis protein [Leuconostoc lactis]|uniref:lipopolysaccharide biosynthesis protein n=1 Tax=Leuconostoc lactis TaxID=1246 RepID=UPI000E8531B5|nr:hypothetical protein [Leuconostoc lactis]HBP97471.1 hypothetical protein [Leuconostoc lactis]
MSDQKSGWLNSTTREKAVKINVAVASISQPMMLIMSFITRAIFIKTLGNTYNGLNGLYSNLLSVLSFAELGIGIAVASAMYVPVANQQYELINTLLNFFRRVYRIIGLIVLIIGFGISFILGNFIKGSIPDYAQIGFILYVFNAALSYWMVTSQTLLAADQKNFVNTGIKFVCSLVFQGIQIFILLRYHNFLLYLIVQIVNTFSLNFIITILVRKNYPFIKGSQLHSIPEKTKNALKHNIFGMMSAKFGGIVLSGSDNIILSAFVGLTLVGQYSNYMIIIAGIVSLMNMIQGGITASVGHLGAQNDKHKEIEIFFQLFAGSSILTVAMSFGMALFFDTIIRLWLGTGFIFDNLTTILLIMMFYTNQIRQISISYITAYSLFWPLRYKSLIEAGVNLLISLLLVIKYQMGVNGVLIGTIIANIGINIIWEGYIVQRLALSNSTLRYFWSVSKVSLVTVVSVWFGINIQQILNINNDLIKMIALTGIYTAFMVIIILVFSIIIPESKNLYKRILRN